MKKALAIAKSNILEIIRDLKSHGIVFILPMVFILIFGFLFSQTHDNQIFVVATIESESDYYNDFLDTLKDLESEKDKKVFSLKEYDNEQKAKDIVQNGSADIALLTGDKTPFKFYINEASQKSAIARSIISDVLTPQTQPLWEVESVITQQNISGFQLQAGGLIIYGILIMIPQIAGSLASLKDKKYLFRYNTSKANAFDIIAGFTISSFIVGIIQALLLFYVASWFGLGLDTNTLSAFIFIIPVIFFAIGTGLIIGTLAPKSSTSQDIGTILSIILGFLSGSFIGGIDLIGFNLGDKFLSITTFIPTFYAYKGITQLIIFEASLKSVLNDFFIISLVSIMLFIAGAVIWKQKASKMSL